MCVCVWLALLDLALTQFGPVDQHCVGIDNKAVQQGQQYSAHEDVIERFIVALEPAAAHERRKWKGTIDIQQV